jgi:TPR repeat protein
MCASVDEDIKKDVIKLLLDQPFLELYSVQPQKLFERGLEYLKENTQESTIRGVCDWVNAGLSLAAGHYFLADMCSYGKTKDPEDAIHYFEIASSLGSTMASFTLGHAYYEGKEVTQNIYKAVSYFEKAGKPETKDIDLPTNKNPVRDGCSFNFFKNHNFEISKKDLQETILFYEFGEKMAPGIAYYNLGLLYGRHEEIKNGEKAQKYIRKAASLGCGEATEFVNLVYKRAAEAIMNYKRNFKK